MNDTTPTISLVSAFSTPFAFFENKELNSPLIDLILSKKTKGIDSNVAVDFKHNLVESKFDFLNQENDITNKTKNWFNDCMKYAINSLNNEIIDYKVTYKESWFHITTTNGMHESHWHPNCSWCGIYYLQSGDEGVGGDTVFENPYKSVNIDQGSRYLHDDSVFRVTPKDGTLVLFPSHISHYQAIYKGVQDRIVVAFNSVVYPKEEVGTINNER